MITVLAYCHKDIEQAARLLGWIRFLAEHEKPWSGPSLVVLVPSRTAAQLSLHRRMAAMAADAFGTAEVCIPDGEDETGWPHSCNYAFKTALIYMGREHPEDAMLWLEPDAVPVQPDWLGAIAEDWEQAQEIGKHFMGAFLPRYPPHISGVAVYGPDWVWSAPRLAQARGEPWDLYAAEDVLKHAHVTRLIQHEQRLQNVDWLHLIKPETVLFHPDKTGRLITLLDHEVFDDEFSKRPTPKLTCVMPRYFHAINSNRLIHANGYEFRFTPYDMLGGIWRGLFAVDKEAEQLALESLTRDARSGITEITRSEYEAKIKKKAGQSADLRTLPPEPHRRPLREAKGVPVAERNGPEASEDQVAAKAEPAPAPADIAVEQLLAPQPVQFLEPPATIKPRRRRAVRTGAPA